MIRRGGQNILTMKLKLYSPFKGITNYYLHYKNQIPVFLYYKSSAECSFKLAIKTNGYIPKSGVFVCKNISKLVKDKSVLDIGTGETAIISIFSSRHGAKNITAVDIDKDAVSWAKHNVSLNKIENIEIFQSDAYSKVNGKFDLIISNPPQLPMPNGSYHDAGGKDGRLTINKIILGAKEHLNPNGTLILLIFDFLGVNSKYGQEKTIFETLKQQGFIPTIIAEVDKVVRHGGKTEESLMEIKKLYPEYKFRINSDGNKLYKMQIVRADLAKS